MRIRAEETSDWAAIRRVNELAFGRPQEARLVERLRDGGAITLSLVAVLAGEVVGHVLFSPVRLQATGKAQALAGVGVGPVAVLPAHQRRGIGAALIETGLCRCRTEGQLFAVVLGHPDYYPRFGFVPGVRYGIRSEFDVPDDVFMVQQLVDGVLAGQTGTIVYPPEFREAT